MLCTSADDVDDERSLLVAVFLINPLISEILFVSSEQ